jgi:hypothetical protein
MYKQELTLLIAFLAISMSLITVGDAAGYQPSVQTFDQVGNILYYRNGTVAYGPGNGTLMVINPSSRSPLSALNITLLNGSTRLVGSMAPSSSYTEDYTIENGDISVPLKFKETIIPSSLYTGLQQEIRLCVDIENTGSGNISGFIYQKALPPGLSNVWTAYDSGTVYVNDTVTWTMENLGSGEKKHLAIAFNLAPTANIQFPEASVHFTKLAPLVSGEPALSGYANTSFRITKSHPSDGVWYIDASVPDESEFTIRLDNVAIYRSDASDPFTTSVIASYDPAMTLEPGCAWKTSLVDNYSLVPAYFIKFSYTIPYTLDRKSYFNAKTEPFTLTVASPPPTATPAPVIPPQSNPYATWTPTVEPTSSPPPLVYPDIVFVTPGRGDVIRDNKTEIETSVPPSSDPGYVVYYGSTDNSTWARIGESSVIGNMSELIWAVPQMNGKYYLKAEHYNSLGLRGVAYTQVIIAHEIQPVGVITMLISGTNWLMLFLALIALLLLLFIIIPYFPRKPIIYDSSALYALSKDDGWLSRLPRRTIRPAECIADIPGVDSIKMKVIRNIDEMRRLEGEHGLQAYDAMALQLARETGATLYTADTRIADISKKLGIDVKPLDKIAVAIKR